MITGSNPEPKTTHVSSSSPGGDTGCELCRLWLQLVQFAKSLKWLYVCIHSSELNPINLPSHVHEPDDRCIQLASSNVA